MLKEKISVLHHGLLCTTFSPVYALLPLFPAYVSKCDYANLQSSACTKSPTKTLSFAASGHSCFHVTNKQSVKSVEDKPKHVFGVNGESVYWNMTLLYCFDRVS